MELMRAPSMKPVTPYIAPARVWTMTVVQNTLTPETLAASALEPTANMFLPKAVLFQMNHISDHKDHGVQHVPRNGNFRTGARW